MSILIGHSSIDERGKIAGGQAGDQTGKEVCTRTWYVGGWNLLLRPKTSELAEKSAKFVEAACGNPNIGYDQYQRNTLYAKAKSVGFDASKISAACECDCSSLMHTAAIAGGANITYGVNGATTRTMRTVLGNSGYYDIVTNSAYLISDAHLKRGDILVKEGSHTVMVLENGSETLPASPPNVNVTYAVKIEGGRILPAVTNLADYAGLENRKIIGVAMKVDKGHIKYQVHVLGGGWLPYVDGYNWNDFDNGYAGNGKVIDAIRVYYSTPSDLVKNGGYREAKYRVSPLGSSNYYDWQVDDIVNRSSAMDGYAGCFGKAMDKFQIQIV